MIKNTSELQTLSLPKSKLLQCENLDLNLCNKQYYRWLTYQQGHTYSQWAHLEEQQTGILTSERACDHYTQFFAVDQDERSVSLSHLWIQNNFLVGRLLHVWYQHTPVTNEDSKHRHSIERFCGRDCWKCCPWLRSWSCITLELVFQIDWSYQNNGKDKKTFSVACIKLQFYHRLFFVDNGCSLVVEECLPAQGCLVFELWTLPNIRLRRCFQDQILHTNCAENLGSWNGSSPTRPRILHQKLFYHHTLVTASLLFHEKTFFTEVFSSFRGRFRVGCRRKNTYLLKFGFWRERRRPLTQASSFVDVAVAPKTSGA